MSHRPTLRATVEWSEGTSTDITALIVGFAADGGGSSDAVERPLATPAAGHLTLSTVDVRDRSARYPLTVTSDGTTTWAGWISEPEFVDQRRRTRWRVTGKSAETLEQLADVSRPAGSATATMRTIAPVDLAQIVDRNHRPINASKPAGEMLSLLAGALNGELVERLDGSLRAASRRPASRTGTQVDAATMWIGLDVESFDAADRIRNRVTVQTAGATVTPDVTIALTSTATRDSPRTARNGAAITQRLTFQLPSDGRTYSDITVALTSVEVSWKKDYGSARSDGSYPGYLGASEIAETCTLSAPTRSGRTVTVTVTVPGNRPDPRLFRADLPTTSSARGASTSPSGFWWYPGAAAGVVHDRYLNYHATSVRFSARLQAVASGTLTPAQFATVIDEESRAAWGVRELRRPDWLIESAASGTALLAALAPLRRYHKFTLPLQQPTAALSLRAATLDSGDYAILTAQDAHRGVDLGGVHTVIVRRRLAVNDTGEAFARFLAVETGLAPSLAAPGAPTGLTITAEHGALEISWTAPAAGGAVRDYRVEWGATTRYDAGAATTTDVARTIGGLAAGATYHVRVRAQNAGGNSAWLTGTGVPTAAPRPPNAPRNLAAGTPTATTIPLTWAAPTGGGAVAAYEVQYRAGTSGDWTQLTAIAGTTRTLSRLASATTYQAQVRARNAAGASAWSPAVTATTAVEAPGTPGAPIASARTAVSITVAWSAPTTGGAPATYELDYRRAGAADWTSVTGLTARTRAVTGLAPAAQYQFRTRARNTAGPSAWSGVSSVSTTAETRLPDTPTHLTPSTVTATTIAVGWAAPTGGGAVATYEARYRAGTSGTWTEITAIAARTRTLTGLTAETTYEIQVRARNAVGASAWSATVTATTPAMLQPPDAPTVVTTGSPTDTTMPLSWLPASTGGAVASYEIEVVTGQTTDIVTGVADTPHTVTGLTAETSYTFRVRARNAAGASAWSPAVTRSTIAAAAGGPSGTLRLLATYPIGGTTWAQLRLTAGAYADHTLADQELRYRTVGASAWTTLGGTTITHRSTVEWLRNLRDSTEVQLRAQWRNTSTMALEWSAWSPSLTITVSAGGGTGPDRTTYRPLTVDTIPLTVDGDLLTVTDSTDPDPDPDPAAGRSLAVDRRPPTVDADPPEEEP